MTDPTWELFDDFLTDRAAGTVNGTAAEPAGGNRVVVDTESKLSITGKNLTFSGGKASPSFTDPQVYWTDTVARAPGKILSIKLNYTTINQDRLGFSTVSGVGSTSTITGFLVTASLYALSTTAQPIVATMATATDYELFVVLRASGAAFFRKTSGGNAILLYISGEGSGATQYVVVGNYASVKNVDYVRHPSSILWLPSILISDGFGSAFGTSDGLGHAEGLAGGLGAGGAGVAWTGATWANVGGRAKNTPGLGSELIVNSGFETLGGGGADVFANWTETGTVTDETVNVNSGAHAASFVTTSSTVSQTVLTIGKWYRATAYVRSLASNSFSYINIGGTINGLSTTSTWQQFARTNRAINTTFAYSSHPSTTYYVDDVSVKEITLADLFRSVTFATADVMVSAEIHAYSTGTQAGLAINIDSTSNPQNLVLVIMSGTNIIVSKCVSGIWTTLATTAFTYVAGKKLVVHKLGTKYRVYYNDVLIGAEQTISDAGIISNTNHGTFSTDIANEFDNFLVYAVTSTDYDNALNVTYTKNPTGTFSFIGLIRRLLNRRVTGGFSFSGILTTSGIGTAIKRTVLLTGRWLTTIILRGKK